VSNSASSTSVLAAPSTAGPRLVRAPRGHQISCRGWEQEAALRVLVSNPDEAASAR